MNSVTNQIVFDLCEADGVVANYKGETSRNMYTRGQEHLRDLKSLKLDPPLWSHCKEHHGARLVSFTMRPSQIPCRDK